MTCCLRNASIAWAYLAGQGSRRAVLYTVDGERYELYFRSVRKAERFLAALEASACSAVFGFSPEARLQFKDWLTRRMLRKGETL